MDKVIEIFESMSDDLKGAIITAFLTSIISIVGFILTNRNMSKNLKNELKKRKNNFTHSKNVGNAICYTMFNGYDGEETVI